MRLAIIIFPLMLFSVPCSASGGLLHGVLANCMDLREMTSQVIAVCVKEYPSLSERANLSLSSWVKRNAPDFDRVSKQCESQLRIQLPGSTNFNHRVKELQEMIVESRKRSLNLTGIAGCEKDLSAIENEANDLARSYPQTAKL